MIQVLLLAFAISPSYASVATIKATTRPTHVTVYPNGARVEREGTVQLDPGPHGVLFSDLPASIVESSLRVSVEGPKGTRYFGVAFRKQFTDKVVDSRARKLRAKIQALQDQRTDLSDKIEAKRAEINILRTYGQGNYRTRGGRGVQALSIKDFEQAASVIGKRIAALTSESRKLERQIREIDLKIGALNRELAQGGAGARERRVAQADIELKQAGHVRFKVSYQVSGASWSPTYDLNLDAKSAKPMLELGFNANVRQTTGEDWKDVTLTLSTARTNAATQVPDPTNWWLGYYTTQIQLYRRIRGVPSAPAAAVRDRAAAEKLVKGRSEELEPAELELARAVQTEYAADYSVTVPKDIPADGSDHRVGILQSKYPVELSEVVVPRLSLSAFVQAKVQYGGEQILLPGPAQLFRDGEFIGNASVSAKAPGESFDVGFGQDDMIRTERKREDNQSTKGDRRVQWITAVTNFHPAARTIEVREQLPRTEQKEIKIDTTDLDPSPLPENPDKPGLLVWKLDLKSKEKALVHFGYRVRYPEGANVSGLE